MADTDSPLKQLFSAFITDFAAWLLQADVHAAYPLTIELPAETLAADQIFHVTLADGHVLVLHIEFQGRTSHQPMEWRLLEYMTRLAHTHRLDLWSVVLYVGRGAGAGDTGHYQVNGPDGTPTLAWRYGVVRLWQMHAEELLAVGRPALLALVGQTQMESPETVLPDVVARLRNVPDPERRGRLLAALTALIPEEAMIAMVERLIDREELLLDTPFLRRIREEGRQEGREEGRQEARAAGYAEGRAAGLHTGLAEGHTVGRVEGILAARRHSILDVLVVRFDPPSSVYQQIERQIETLTDEAHLAQLLAAATRLESVAAFQAVLGSEQRHR
jgi:predicted transposase YdaD